MNRHLKIFLILFWHSSFNLYGQNFKRQVNESVEQFTLRCKPSLNEELCSDVIETDLWNSKNKMIIAFYSVIESQKSREKDIEYFVSGYIFIPIGNEIYTRISIDQYVQEGGDAKIESVFFANADKDQKNEMIILCSWEQNHYSISSGKLYQAYFYDDIDFTKLPEHLILIENLKQEFKMEFDGVNADGEFTAKYKSEIEIKNRLKQLGY